MECQTKDSKKIFKVFDATKRKRTRKKHETMEDWQSVASDGSKDRRATSRHVSSTKGSYHELARSPNRNLGDDLHGKGVKERHSEQSVHSQQGEVHRSRSGRRHRRVPREEVSLALRAGLVSTPRSLSPHQNCDGLDTAPRDENSFMEGLLEEAIKQDRRKHRQSRHSHDTRDRRESSPRERRHRHKNVDKDKTKKEEKSAIDQAALFETFIKLCSQMQVNTGHVPRTHSNKSLQCDQSRHRLHCQRSRESSKHNMTPTRIRSQEECRSKMQTRDRNVDGIQTGYGPYDKNRSRYASRVNEEDTDERLRRYSLKVSPTRCQMDVPVHDRSYEYERRKIHDDDRRIGHRMSRSFDVPRDDRIYRTDGVRNKSFDSGIYREKMYDDRRYRKDYYDKDYYHRDYTKRNRMYRNIDQDRASIISTDDFRNREKYYERERDSGLSVVDDESIASCKSNYLRAVKQEITEQREAMDKMMKLWKELMRTFKGHSQREPTKSVIETTANVRESAAAQLQLWRECMRRYETVARDVGDTDARLMEEINKQRSEMSEMTAMFNECLQRYKDMSHDFHTLKHQLQSESPVRLSGACPAPCTDGDGLPAHYRLPAYPPHMAAAPHVAMGYPPLRAQASAPPPIPPVPATLAPPCCWGVPGGRGYSPRRSSPDSRACRDHRHRDRGESRCKEKSKPSGSKSEHRHRRR